MTGETLAHVLCGNGETDPCAGCRDRALRILDDPGPLLGALARAGVLNVETVRPMWPAGPELTRYVCEVPV